MEMVDKATEKRWKRKMGRLLWTRRLYSPWFLLVYYWFWRTLFRFCWLGGVRRRTPVLTGCIFLFFLYFFWYLWERHLYRKNSYPGVGKKLEIEENRLVFVDGSQVKLGEMRWYRTKGEQAWLCLKGHRFLWVDMAEWPEKKKGLFRMKLTQRGLLAGHFWKLPVAVCLAAVTLLGCAGVVWTATPYNGKLSWKIDEWRYPEKWQEPEKNKTEDIFL